MFRFLLCDLLGHAFYTIQEFSSYSRRIGCVTCTPKKGISWGMNDNCQGILKWNKEMEEMYESFGNYIMKV